MSATTVIHVRDANWADGDIYIGRAVPRQGLKASPFANPFKIGDRHPAFGYKMDRAFVIIEYKNWVQTSKDPRAVWVRANVHRLHGHRIACHCAPLACHGDVLAAMADAAVVATVPGTGSPPALGVNPRHL